jgi:hydroxyacylglutathione hydrolase
MITIQTFEFNDFQVNTYLLYDETSDCIIIDPGCIRPHEQIQITAFISQHKLHPVGLYNTHTHVDHIAGNKFIAETYNLGLLVHRAGLSFLHSAKGYGVAFGLDNIESVDPSGFIDEGDIISFGNSSLSILYTPGHADGSVCFYSEKENFVIVGDVLFCDSIGRTDFPTGNFDLLMESIKTKLFTLPGETLVYPGHGPTTTIGYEKENNPFIM